MPNQILNKIILSSLIIFFLLFIFFLHSLNYLNPDYLPYFNIYYFPPEDKSCVNILSCYIGLHYTFDFLNDFIDYHSFRLIFLLIPSLYLFYKVIRNSYNKYSYFHFFIILFILSTFLFEYFIIRYRAGFSILFFLIFLEFIKSKFYFFKISSFIFLFFSFFYHPITFLLISFISIIIIIDFNFLLKIFLTLLFFIAILVYNETRLILSPLSIFRFYSNYFLIFILFLIQRFYFKKKLNIETFLFLYVLFVCCLYFLDFSNFIGESITRISSLLSLVYFYFFYIDNKKYSNISNKSVSLVFIAINSLGFYKSIFYNFVYYKINMIV